MRTRGPHRGSPLVEAGCFQGPGSTRGLPPLMEAVQSDNIHSVPSEQRVREGGRKAALVSTKHTGSPTRISSPSPV